MIAVVVMAHDGLAGALVAAGVALAGAQTSLYALDLMLGERPAAYAQRLEAVRASAREGGLLMLCDMLGGTPQRVALASLGGGGAGPGACAEAAVVSGVNLGMLCEALLARDRVDSVAELARLVVDAGGRQIVLGASDETPDG
ncbi:MAG: hypothetical protein GX557_03310 [Chloroflexi bacterium]|nr:hypothetical protein [Chloroflexota bacterium]